MKKHLERLIVVGYFVAPSVFEVVPRIIAPGVEYIEILTGGKILYTHEGIEKTYAKGTVLWHKEGEKTISKTFADDPYRCFIFKFKVLDCNRPAPKISIWHDMQEATLFFNECHKAFHSGSEDLEALADYAYSTIRWKTLSSRKTCPQNCPHTLLKIRDYLHNHLQHDITIQQLADLGGMSKSHFFSLFKTYFGDTPEHYIQKQRIVQAKKMLSSPTPPSIKEIAKLCGFNSLPVFYRQFKRNTSITPLEYQKKYLVQVRTGTISAL